MSAEDRLRATTEAVTEAMRPVRSLDLTSAPAGARPRAARAPAGPRGPGRPRRWSGWLIPLAAAAAVLAVAVTLVAVRDIPVAQPTPADSSRPAATATSTAAPPPASPVVPQYGVTLSADARSPVRKAIVVDARTGNQLAVFAPPANATFAGLAAAQDDKTFVLDARTFWDPPRWGPPTHIWYLLRLSPGSARPARLTRIPIAASFSASEIVGLAVSPDDRTLAILFQPDVIDVSVKTPPGAITIRTYSLATGKALRTWTEPVPSTAAGTTLNSDNADSLTWLGDGRTLAFTYPSFAARQTVRTLDTTSPGTNLVADSRPAFRVPAGRACGYLLMTPDGQTVICGTSTDAQGGCAKGQPEFDAYSVATGQLDRVLYRHQGSCALGVAIVEWAGDGTLAIGLVETFKSLDFSFPAKDTNAVGVLAPGKLAPLRVTLTGSDYGPGTVAF
ncbi:MAG TPA: hypothetical protein VHT26_15925 [Trebonia sp.]|nr:hypothetical protein [Trebonia sp.]